MKGITIMTMQDDNKAIVGRWFTEFWGNPWNPDVVDELAAPDIRFHYSLHAPLEGRAYGARIPRPRQGAVRLREDSCGRETAAFVLAD
jgi:hypothetical protein